MTDSLDTEHEAVLDIATQYTDVPVEPRSTVVSDLTHIALDPERDLLIRVTNGVTLVVAAPVLLLVAHLAEPVEMLYCKGRAPFGLNIPECGDTALHDPHKGIVA